MTETLTQRIQRLINEKRSEDLAASDARIAAEKAKRLSDLASLDIDTKLNSLQTELDSQSDEEIKTKGKRYLKTKLDEAKELEEEKTRRRG